MGGPLELTAGLFLFDIPCLAAGPFQKHLHSYHEK